MSLRDKLARPVEPTHVPIRMKHPSGWEPGVKFDASGVPETVITPPMAEYTGDVADVLATFPFTLPEGYTLALVEAKFDPAAWHRDEDDRYGADGGKSPAYTKAVWRYKFKVVLQPAASSIEDVVESFNKLKRAPHRKATKKFTGEAALQTAISDTQYGKVVADGGTDALVERLENVFSQVEDHAKFLGKDKIGTLVVPLIGDLVEGCTIYPNQSLQVDRVHREQVRDMTIVLLNYLDRLAPLFNRVIVPSAPGNHGEIRVNGKSLHPRENLDSLVAESAAIAASRDPKLSHVSFVIHDETPVTTLDVLGHTFAYTHGDVYGRGGSGPADVKAYNWYKNQAAGKQPAGDADVLVGAHFHHAIYKDFGHLTFMQTPALDSGSPQFSNYSGQVTQPGMLTWVTTPENSVTDWHIIRP